MHQIYHSILTAFELSRMHDEIRVEIIANEGANQTIVERVAAWYPDHRASLRFLRLPRWFRWFNPGRRLYPPAWMMFLRAIPRVAGAAAIVTTSHDTKGYMNWLGLTGPKVIYQQHGGGDGAYGFEPKLREFDRLLTTGPHLQRRYEAEGIGGPDRVKVVGSPKLDLVRFHRQHARLPFENDAPVVLYSPHWRPQISSFPSWGRRVLDFFATHEGYNLVFAPHLLVRQWARRFDYDLDFTPWERCKNIVVDLGSERSIDLTYTALADVYLGDVSSQVVEWVAVRPRPCVFLNAHRVQWREDTNYRFWEFGPVIDDLTPGALETALQRSRDEQWMSVQWARRSEYVDETSEPASKRAAREIIAVVANGAR